MKKLAQYLILLTLTVLLSSGIIWANRQAKDEVCKGVVIDISNADSLSFVTKGGILKELSLLDMRIEGEKLAHIDTEAIEHGLERSEYLENVECSILNNGMILIQATQMVPIMRIFDGSDSYYVNRFGKRMHATAKYHIDVPVVEGHFTRDFSPLALVPLITYVQQDKMLNSLVTMYSVRDSSNIFIVPCIYGHVVNIGNVHDLDNKFAKLKQFYREVMPVKGWLTYDTISVKWNHQIVATRHNKAAKEEVSYNPDDDEQAPDLGTILIPDKPGAGGSASKVLKDDPDSKDKHQVKSLGAPTKATTSHEESRIAGEKKATDKASDKKKAKDARSADKVKAENHSSKASASSKTDDKVKNAFSKSQKDKKDSKKKK